MNLSRSSRSCLASLHPGCYAGQFPPLARRPLHPVLNLPARHVLSSFASKCAICLALRFREEKGSFCCHDGGVRLDLLTPPPEPLSSLFTRLDTPCKSPLPRRSPFFCLIVSASFLRHPRIQQCFFVFILGTQSRFLVDGYSRCLQLPHSRSIMSFDELSCFVALVNRQSLRKFI